MKFAYLGAAAAIAAALAVAAPASAQDAAAPQFYGSVNVGVNTLKIDEPLDDASLPTQGGRIGWKANKWVGIEGDLFFGVKSDTIYDAPEVKVKLDSAAFIYGVAYLPAGEKFDLIGRVGYGHIAAKVKGAGVSESTNDGAVSYGVGAQYKFDAISGVRFDYTHYDIDDVPANGFTVAYVRAF